MAEKRSVGARLRLWTDDYKRDAGQAVRANERIGDSGKRAKRDLDGMAMGLGIVGGLMVAAAGAAVYATAKFDKQMSEVKAVSGATADELGRLRQAALDAGAATVFSASEAAQAEAELAKAGVKTADILGGALTGSLSLAAAGSLDLATAATISANAMNTFGLSGMDVGHIADVLAAASNKSAASVEDLGLSLQQVGLVANQVGFTLEETVGLLAAFADRGLRGSDGATSLKTALLRLAAPEREAAAAMKQFGISLYDSTGAMVDAGTIAGQLQKGLGGLSAAQRNAALSTIFGSDAIRAGNILYTLGEKGIRDYIAAVDDQGAAARVAAEKLNNLAGDVEALKGSLETLFIQSGSGAQGPLRDLTQEATRAVNAFAALPGPVQAAGTFIVGVTGLSLLAAAAMIKLNAATARAVESMALMGPAGVLAGKGMQAVIGWGMRATIVLGAVAIAGHAVTSAMSSAATPDIDAYAKSLQHWAETGEISGEAARMLGKDLEQLNYDILGVDSAVLAGIGEAIAGFAEGITGANGLAESDARLRALDSSLAQLVNSGHAEDAAIVFARIAAAAEAQGIGVTDVQAAMVEYQRALEQLDPAQQEQVKLAEEAARQNIAMGGAFGDAANEIDGLRKAFDSLNGAMLTWRGAERDAEEAADDLAEALRKSGGSLDATTEKGRKAAEAVDAMAIAAAEAAQAKYDETGSIEEANATYQKYIDMLRNLLRQAGLSEDAVSGLIDSIASMPTYKAVTIGLNLQWNPLHGLNIGLGGVAVMKRWGGIDYAAQGLVRQAGVFRRPTLFAEPETGGEAYIPRRGNYSRNMSILSEAAGWHGADVVPRGSWGGGGASAVDVRVSLAPGADGAIGRAIEDRLRFEVTQTGTGSVQQHYGRRGRL